MSFHVQQEATEGAYGRLTIDKYIYRPLDIVTVNIVGRDIGDEICTIRVTNSEQQLYFESEVKLINNQGEIQFSTGGLLGVHYVYLIWPGEPLHSRYTNFRLDCETCIESSDSDFDDLYPFTREAMLRGRREYSMPAGNFIGYISADTVHFDGIWLRDCIYSLSAFRHWEQDITCCLDRFLEQQHDNGMIPDGIERDGHTWRVGLESDVEYIIVLGVWQTWQATGNDAWLASVLPRLERALTYIQNDEKHWDSKLHLVKRQHSCDTWDFDIDGASDSGTDRHVIATCDQSGYVQAFQIMSYMYSHLGNKNKAEQWQKDAEAYRKRANELLWDGAKYLHHKHLDEIDHGSFDESEQLAMGNTWAMTRGLATPKQARSIIDEYRRRHEETGDAFPWWSLQPGYPDSLGYFHESHRQQGGYANGGLMPWVGGELCRASFMFGREKYGVELLRAYSEHLRTTGGAQVWYWPDGTPGCRTNNEVRYAGWGMAEWVNALLEGLAGVRDESGQMRKVTVSPCWSVAGVNKVFTVVRYAASKAYFAYSMDVNFNLNEITIKCTGSGEFVKLQLLLPEGWKVKTVKVDGISHNFESIQENTSSYIQLEISQTVTRSLVFKCA